MVESRDEGRWVALAKEALKEALKRFGRLDILVSNAAMRNYSALGDATPEEWQSVVSVNLLGAANYCKAALPALRRAGKGSIVNVSSCYAVTGRRGMGLYDATKAAMLAMTRTLAFEESEHGVRVNAVCPGLITTRWFVDGIGQAGADKVKATYEQTVPLERLLPLGVIPEHRDAVHW